MTDPWVPVAPATVVAPPTVVGPPRRGAPALAGFLLAMLATPVVLVGADWVFVLEHDGWMPVGVVALLLGAVLLLCRPHDTYRRALVVWTVLWSAVMLAAAAAALYVIYLALSSMHF